jgi:hypothetical protein
MEKRPRRRTEGYFLGELINVHVAAAFAADPVLTITTNELL